MMIDSVSPYALLCASKPKKQAAYSTPYDLFSAAQQAAMPAEDVAAPSSSMPQQQAPAAKAPNMPLIPAKKTHYIADIHSRHSAAIRHASLQDHRI